MQIIHAFVPRLFTATKFAVEDIPVAADAGSNALLMTTEMGVPQFRPRSAAVSARDAWALELSLRPWRNMPLRLPNVANVLSSSALVLLLAFYGVAKVRKAGFTPVDRFMLAMFVAIPVFAFLPQTVLWVLRSFTDVYPATLEEVRAIGFIMIPALYFVLRLLQKILADGGPHRTLKAFALIVGVIALPLTVKSINSSAREGILSAMTALHMVNSANSASVANARSALGIAYSTPFYYSTQGVIRWTRENTAPNSRILTDRDELVLLRDRQIVGPRQVAAVPPRDNVELPDSTQLFFQTKQAMQSRDLAQVQRLAMSFGADFVVVPWRVDGAPFHDDDFSVVSVPRLK